MSVLTVAYPGIDSVVDAVAAWITGAQFADALSDIQQARGDGLDLPLPQVVLTADVDPKTITTFPAVLVIGGVGDSSGSDEPRNSEIRVSILIFVVLAGEDPVVLAKQMQRYLMALWLCFARTRSFYPLLPFAPSRLGAQRPDPTRGPISGLNNRYLKAGTFDLIVPIASDT